MTPEEKEKRKRKAIAVARAKAALQASATVAEPEPGPKMPIGEAARIAGRQGRTLSLADEAAGIRGMAGIPQWADAAYQAVNPLARYADVGLGLAGLAGEAMGAMPKSYEQARDIARGELTQARTDRPVTSFLAEMGEGAVYPAGTLRMGAPIVSQSAKMAGIGSLYGGATGYAGAEGDTEQRLGGAALYGSIGAGIGAITPGAAAAALPAFRAGRTAIAEASDAIVNFFGGTGTASEQAAREVAEAAVRRSMERSNMTPERIVEMLEQYRDKPAVLAEVIGQDALNALTALTRRPGATPQLAQDIIAERFGAFPERAGADVRGAADVPEAFIEGDLSAELAARRAAAGPEYQQLYAETPITQTMQPAQQGPVTSERLRNLMETPFISSKLRAAQNNAITRAVAEGRSPDSVTTLEILDSVKRIVDDEIGKAVKNKAAEEINFLTTTRDALVGELDRITEGRYAAVREIGGEAPRLQAAQQLGNKWRTMKLPEFMRAVQETNPQDMPALQAAVMGSLENSLRRGELNPRVFRTQDIQGKIRAVFGPEAGDELIRRMVAEAELRETGARFAPRVNSVTGTVLESAPSEMLDEGIRFATALARGDRIGIVNQAISFMRRRGYTQRQIDEMGRLLLSDPQEGLRRLGVRLPTAPNTGGAAGIAAPNAFTGGGPEGPAGGSGPAGPQGPSGGSMPSGGGISAIPEANPFASAQAAPEATENAFTSPYFGRQSMRAARDRGPSERVLAMQEDWAPVQANMGNARAAATEASRLAQQATMIRSGPDRQAAAERAAQAMQAVRRQVQDIQAQRGGIVTPEDQRLQDIIDLLEPTNDPVLLQTQATMVQQNLARINQAIGLSEVPRPMPPQPSAARRLGFMPTVRDESAVAGPRPVAGRYAGAGDDVQPMGFGASTPKTPQQAIRFETPGSPEYEAAVAKGLDMSTEARMARAKEMGFDTDTVLYHGTSDDFEAFSLAEGGKAQGVDMGGAIFMAANPDHAAGFAMQAQVSKEIRQMQKWAKDNGYDFGDRRVLKRFQKVAEEKGFFNEGGALDGYPDHELVALLEAGGASRNIMPLFTRLKNPKIISAPQNFEGQSEMKHMFGSLDKGIIRRAREEGHDGVIFEDAIDGGKRGKFVVVFDPANIRSVHAAFDPDKAASSQLMAGFPSPNAFVEAGAGSIGGSVAGQQYDITGDGVIDERDVQAGALLGMVGVPAIGAAARRMGRNAMAQGDMQTMGIGGDVPKPVQQARQTGYEGADTGESKEWLSAIRKGLRMDTESRLARAREMGFDTETVLYRGRRGDYSNFDLKRVGTGFNKKNTVDERAIFFDESPNVANAYARRGERRGTEYPAGSNVMPVYVRGRIKTIDMKQRDYDNMPPRNGKPGLQSYLEEAAEEGYDGVRFLNLRDVGSKHRGSTQLAIFDPKNIRSVHAAFDPEKSSSPELLAGLPFAVGGAGLTAERESGARMKDDTIRADGTKKGTGFLGPLKRPDGMIMTEYSIGVNIDGKDVEIPTLVPTLTQDEIDLLLNLPDGDKPPRAIINKAIDHARNRIKNNKSPFWNPQDDGQPTPKKAAPSAVGGVGLGMGAMQSEERPNAFVQ